jgi:quinol monooxygenase YgiN
MSVVRHYRMRAKAGGAQAAIDALTDLAREIRPLEGCLGFEILQDQADPLEFVFIERWASIADHQATGSKVTRNVVAPLTAALDGPAEGLYLDPIFTL